MILGLTGRNGAGKGEAVEFFKSKGFHTHSLSDVIREEARRREIPLTRDNLLATGRELREKHGAGILAERILARLESGRNAVVDSIRHEDEVTALRKASDFHLIVVRADAAGRFERIRARKRESDPTTLEAFEKLEREEATRQRAGGQDLTATEALANHAVDNNGTLEEFRAKLDALIPMLMNRMKRPGWDEYFMRIAQVASLRSNCAKRKVAAVIVRDKRVISTGYNGTPRGTKNCYEGGCPRCNSMAASGTKLDECLCSHGEENALIQAAYHGVAVKAATLYTTFAPCLTCTKMIINAGLREVVYNMDYPLNDVSFALLREAGVACRKLKLAAGS